MIAAGATAPACSTNPPTRPWGRLQWPPGSPLAREGCDRKNSMKVKPSVKKMCDKCKVIRRHGRVMVICENLRHKQRQG